MRRLPGKCPELYKQLKKADEDHYRSVDLLMGKLKDLKGDIVVHRRGEDKMPSVGANDVVLALGGDGTFIYTSHYIKNAIMIGVNSAPNHSVGHYCAFNLFNEKIDIPQVIESIREGVIKPTDIYRLRVHKSGETRPVRIINDALFTDINPAITSRYELMVNGSLSTQKSSGLWISTSMGSSAAFSSAGGKPFQQANKKGQKQFGVAVRELYGGGGKKPETYLIDETQSFEVKSAMVEGILYMDGGQRKLKVDIGDKLRFDFYEEPLPVLLQKDLKP